MACSVHLQTVLLDIFNETSHYITVHVDKPIFLKSVHEKDVICTNLYFCDKLNNNGEWLKPKDGKVSVHIPLESNKNHHFEIEFMHENKTFVFFPHVGGFNRLLRVLPRNMVVHVESSIDKMHNHANFELERESLELYLNGHEKVLTNSSYDMETHATQLYIRKKLVKRNVYSNQTAKFNTNYIVHLLAQLGYNTKMLLFNAKLLLDLDNYLNTMEFIKFYYDKAWPVVWQSFPIMQNKIANWMEQQKHVNISNYKGEHNYDIKNPIKETEKLKETTHSKDLRAIFAHNLAQETLSRNNWTTTFGDSPKEIYEQLMPFYNDVPDLSAVMNVTSDLKFGTLFGTLDRIKNVMLEASTIMYLKSFKYVQISNRLFTKITDFEINFPGSSKLLFLFKGRFNLSLANIYHFIAAVASVTMFYGFYHTSPISDKDVVSFKKAPSAMNILHVWLKDPSSGAPTPQKEYRLRSIIDWFPRLYFGVLMSMITAAFELGGPSKHYSGRMAGRLFLAINAAMFVPVAFQIDMIEGETNLARFKQLDKLFVPGFIIGYGWNIMSLLVLLRPGAFAIDEAVKSNPSNYILNKYSQFTGLNGQSRGKSLELYWEYMKGVVFGIPQTFGVYHLIKLMKERVHFNDYRQVGIWSIQSSAWLLDVTNNWSVLLQSLDKSSDATNIWFMVQGQTGLAMTFLYTSRSYWEALHGMPCMFIYYQSYFTPATDLVERYHQVQKVIPLELQQWQDIHDPPNEKLLREKGIKIN